MKAGFVYDRIRWHLSNHEHKFQNVYVYSWESDHFSVTSSMYAYEVEVKVSRSDFFADFKKPKHHFFKSIKNGFSILKDGTSWMYDSWRAFDKYPELKDFRIDYTNIKVLPINFRSCPNKFYFACPVGLIEAAEIPKYAGLLYILDNGDVREIVKPPFIHKDRFVPSEMLFSKYLYECLELRGIKRDYDALYEKFNELRKLYEDTRTEKELMIKL